MGSTVIDKDRDCLPGSKDNSSRGLGRKTHHHLERRGPGGSRTEQKPQLGGGVAEETEML